MNEKLIDTNGLRLCVEEFGHPDDPALFLIMGLGTQMIAWPNNLIDTLVDEGFRVIRFDNRDVGKSSNMAHLGDANVKRAMVNAFLGLRGTPRYHLEDMALDLIGMMDALDIDSAHIAGASMGGMIAQVAAIRHPDRIRSLTSLMSAFGAHPLRTRTRPSALKALRLKPAGPAVQEVEQHILRIFDIIGSPGYPYDENELRQRARLAVDRGVNIPGTARQLEAILSAGRQGHHLTKITAPTLVLHGEDDPLIPVTAGMHNAKSIPGARMVTWPGMGHDLPPALAPEIAQEIARHARMAEQNLRLAA